MTARLLCISFIFKLLGTYIYIEWKNEGWKVQEKNVCRIKYEIWYLSSRNVIFWSASGKSAEVSSHNCVWSDNSSEATGKRTAQLLVDVEFELYSVLLLVEKKQPKGPPTPVRMSTVLWAQLKSPKSLEDVVVCWKTSWFLEGATGGLVSGAE